MRPRPDDERLVGGARPAAGAEGRVPHGTLACAADVEGFPPPAAPKHGATYRGKNDDGIFSYPIRFTISGNGKKVTKIRYAVFVQCISVPTGIPFRTVRSVAIRKGRFTLFEQGKGRKPIRCKGSTRWTAKA